MIDRPSGPVPITLLTGFLGSGKTTVLNGLLRHPALPDASLHMILLALDATEG